MWNVLILIAVFGFIYNIYDYTKTAINKAKKTVKNKGKDKNKESDLDKDTIKFILIILGVIILIIIGIIYRYNHETTPTEDICTAIIIAGLCIAYAIQQKKE